MKSLCSHKNSKNSHPLVAIILVWGVFSSICGWARFGSGGVEEGMAPLARLAPAPRPQARQGHSTITLEPFYLVREKAPQIWVERIMVTLTVAEGEDMSAARVRDLVFQALSNGKNEKYVQEEVTASLKHHLGSQKVLSAKVDRSILLLP